MSISVLQVVENRSVLSSCEGASEAEEVEGGLPDSTAPLLVAAGEACGRGFWYTSKVLKH